MFRDISIDAALQLEEKIIIDVRSPGEYITATVPGSVNVPLLDNVERSLVGTAYRQQGPQVARELAMNIVSPKLPSIINTVKEVCQGKPVVLFCWRGGDRSLFMAQILSFMGFRVYRVTGGFKAYRRQVRNYLEREYIPIKAVVLHGLTGVGKTEVLKALAEKGLPVLDLEGLSCHRGSVFGKIGMPPSPSQKMFEALIYEQLTKVERYGVFIVECESKRLGNLLVPASIMRTMKAGYNVLLYAPIEDRVKRIKRVYAGETGAKQSLQDAVGRLTRYLGSKKVDELNAEIQNNNIEPVIWYLFLNYYDPLYGYPATPGDKSDEYDFSVNTENLAAAVEQLTGFINQLPEFNKLSYRGGMPNGNRFGFKDSTGKAEYIPGSCGERNKNPKEIFNCFGRGEF